MFRLHSTKWLIALVIAAIIAAGITIGRDSGNQLTTQTAIGQTLDEDLQYLERSNRAFIKLVNNVKPSVVQVTTTKLINQQNRSQNPFNFDEDLFEYFFGPRRDRNPQDRPENPDRRNERERRNNQDQPDEQEREVPGGLGSGVIVTEDGYILTNNHVIEDAEGITVILPSGREYPAKLVGRDAGFGGTDLAVLKINGENLPALQFGNSDNLEVGEWVVAIGSPFGLAQTATRGMVSAKGRTPGMVTYGDFIQTDASINRGNSGGALINIRGELIGINTAIVTGGNASLGNVGIGFAIPSNLAKRVMEALIDKGTVERGWLGVNIGDLTHELAEEFKLNEPRGALITGVIKDTPADKGGIKRGDIVVQIDNIPIRNSTHLLHIVAGIEVGKTAKIKVMRKGKEKDLKVTLGKRPPQEELVSMSRGGRGRQLVPDDETENAFVGLHVTELTDEIAERYNHEGEKGVVVLRIEPRSAAARAGIRVGDLIQEVEHEEVKTVDEFRKRIKDAKSEPKILLYVRHANRQGGEYLTLRNE